MSNWIRSDDETDAEYAERCAWLDSMFPPPVERVARSTANLTDTEMAAILAARTPPEQDYDDGAEN